MEYGEVPESCILHKGKYLIPRIVLGIGWIQLVIYGYEADMRSPFSNNIDHIFMHGKFDMPAELYIPSQKEVQNF